ncbi:phosphopantetheine-binding protein [Streptomyces sp. NPDC060194]|uniref:phosphopantetheine-binding protein n=1 Tax=Streptomyces sp. NPDC060194 TaxID=3347069 RepID=UPI003655929D
MSSSAARPAVAAAAPAVPAPDRLSVDAVVKEVLSGKFEVPAGDLVPDATLGSLDLDSLSLAELALALQEELGFKVEEHEAAKDTTVGELLMTLNAKRAAADTL